jgi:mannonate dehydratase
MAEHLNRREVGKMALTGALGAMLFDSSQTNAGSVRPQPPGIKLGSAAPADPTDEDLLFFRQLGVDCVYCAVTPDRSSVESLLKIKKRYADAGLTVHNIRNLGVRRTIR